ncbi:MAG: hypothetical protein ACSW8I_06910 [bacterium]
MNIEEQLTNLSHLSCPKQVDVVDHVMAQVRQTSHNTPQIKSVVWRRVAITAVAAIAALVVVNIATTRSYDDAQLGSMMAYFSNYDNYTVESAAVNPIEYLYEDEY